MNEMEKALLGWKFFKRLHAFLEVLQSSEKNLLSLTPFVILVLCIARVIVIFMIREHRSKVFLGKGVPKICSKFTGEHPCQSGMGVLL